MRFYVYVLVDPRDGGVFYVGKGCGSRVRNHESDAKRGVDGPKCDRIREIWAAGAMVEREVLGYFEREVDAYRAEELAINHIGLDKLTNRTGGGRGGRGRKRKPFRWTPELVRAIGPKLLRALIAIGVRGGVSAVGLDVTAAVQKLARRIRSDMGDEAFFVALGI